MDESENDLMSFIEQNEGLRRKNDHLVADNQKLRQEILKVTRQIHSDIMDSSFNYSSEPFGKDEPTEKKEISDADFQTEDFGHLQDGCTVCTIIKLIEVLDQQFKHEQTAKKEELGSATQKIAMLTECLEIELKAKQALQTEHDRVKADQRKLKEAIAKEIVDVQKKQEPKTFGYFKPLLVGFMVTLIIVFLDSLFAVSIDSTDPNALYDRHQYI